MATLPRELLYLVAQHLHRDGVSLVPYSTVCRHWQPTFESLIFSTLTIHSGNSSNDNKVPGKKGISLGQFEEATSGSKATRRAYIHNLQFDVLVPYELLDWTSRKEAGYTTKNTIREANDEAFEAAITSLFHILSSWDEQIRLSLQIGLLGCQQGRGALEPVTRYFSNAGDYRYDYRNGRTKSVPPYRARFSSANIVLPAVPCVDKLIFANIRFRDPKMSEDHRVVSVDEDEALDTRPRNRWHQVWAGAVFRIAQHCPTVTELSVDLDEWVRPDYLQYIKERRAAVADGLQALPASLRVLDYSGQQEYPWKETQPALNVLKTETDTLATSLQSISLVLRELHLTNVTLPMDFLWPLDGSGNPIANPTHHWFYLRLLILDEVPPFLPSGKWLADPEAEDQEEINNISDWEDEICNYERGFVDRPVLDTEQFHRLFISWGHAARHAMAQIVLMKFSLDHSPTVQFTFSVAGGGGCGDNAEADGATLEWVVSCGYRPDQRVARAWGFEVDEILGTDDTGSDEEEDFSVVLPRWRPGV
ncbi:hypothetical protein BDW75DRAFT_134398 [Aspergillus navahoensis]